MKLKQVAIKLDRLSRFESVRLLINNIKREISRSELGKYNLEGLSILKCIE